MQIFSSVETQSNSDLKFIKAYRDEFTPYESVYADYTYQGVPFTIEWTVDLQRGTQFQIEGVTFAKTDEILKIIDNAIQSGEDSELYLALRDDSFDSRDAYLLPFDLNDMTVTDTILFGVYADPSKDKITYAITFVIDDIAVIQYDSEEGFSIPISNEYTHNSEFAQDMFYQAVDPNDLAKTIKLPTNLEDLMRQENPEIKGVFERRPDLLEKALERNL